MVHLFCARKHKKPSQKPPTLKPTGTKIEKGVENNFFFVSSSFRAFVIICFFVSCLSRLGVIRFECEEQVFSLGIRLLS
jgi:hypothetical protein